MRLFKIEEIQVLHNTQGTSDKIYAVMTAREICQETGNLHEDSSLIVNWGRRGGSTSTQIKYAGNYRNIAHEEHSLISTKTRRGYRKADKSLSVNKIGNVIGIDSKNSEEILRKDKVRLVHESYEAYVEEIVKGLEINVDFDQFEWE